MIFGAKTRPKLYDRRELFISWHLVKGGREGERKGKGRERGRGRDLRGIPLKFHFLPVRPHLLRLLLLSIAHSSINSSVDESTDLEAQSPTHITALGTKPHYMRFLGTILYLKLSSGSLPLEASWERLAGALVLHVSHLL